VVPQKLTVNYCFGLHPIFKQTIHNCSNQHISNYILILNTKKLGGFRKCYKLPPIIIHSSDFPWNKPSSK
jgi:hypothetical protein